MRLFFFPLILLSLLAFSAYSTKVDLNTAKMVAQSFLQSAGHDGQLTISSTEQAISLQADGITTLYVIALEPKGFIMVSADDASSPIPCYSFESDYHTGNQPENFKAWINGYSEQVLNGIRTNSHADQKTLNQWEKLGAGTPQKSANTIVGPLITSTWDQGYPYNYLCPEDAGGSGGHVWAGCVATAMAQVANYWRWPLQGTGSHGYYSDYGYLWADYGSSYYNWEEMTNSIEGENFQMAQIQYHMGIAVNMMYGPGGSGAYSDDAANALINYFGMDPGLHLEYAPTPINENWKSLLRSEIDAGRPMYYHGFGSGGHAFNVDGYNGPDYFHFNWGWSGSFNGYYYLDNLNPGGSNFTEGQGAIVGILPTGNYPYYCNSTDTLRMFSGTIEDGSGPTQSYMGDSNCGWLIIPEDSITSIKLTFHRFDLGNDGDMLIIYDGTDTDSPILATYTGNTLPPVTSSSGGTMFIKFISNSGNNAGGWFASYDANRAVFCSGITTLTDPTGSIDDGSGTFEYHPNSVCRYRIVPDNAESITLTFDEFSTYDENDYLKIYDHTNNTLLQTLSGNANPGTLTFPTGKLLMMFHSNSENNAQGWRFHYASSIHTGTGDLHGSGSVRVSPNPADAFLDVDIIAAVPGDYLLKLYTADGIRAYQNTLKADQPGIYKDHFNVDHLYNGIYILRITTPKGEFNQKIIIQH